MHVVREPRSMPHNLVASGDEPSQALGRSVERSDFLKVAGGVNVRQRPSIYPVSLHNGMHDRLPLQGTGDHHPRHGPAFARRLAHDLVTCVKRSSAVLRMAIRTANRRMALSQIITSPKVRWTSIPITRCIRASSSATRTGAVGRYDPYRSVRVARRASRRGGQLLMRDRSSSYTSACPHLRAPGVSVPDARSISHKRTTDGRNRDPGHLILVTHPIERPNKGDKCRADIVRVFPNDASIMRLIGAVLLEANDEWKTSNHSMMVAAFAPLEKEEITLLSA